MPLPAVLRDYGLPESICCDGFFAPAERMRVAGHNTLMDCLPPEVCDEGIFTSYVTHGFDADDPIGDSLAVSLSDIRPVAQSEQRAIGSASIILSRCTYQVRLYETGWPMLSEDGDGHVLLPDREEQHFATMHSFSHMERVWRTIMDGIARRTLFAQLPVYKVDVGPTRPIEPSGNLVGWRMEVVIDLGWTG